MYFSGNFLNYANQSGFNSAGHIFPMHASVSCTIDLRGSAYNLHYLDFLLHLKLPIVSVHTSKIQYTKKK